MLLDSYKALSYPFISFNKLLLLKSAIVGLLDVVFD